MRRRPKSPRTEQSRTSHLKEVTRILRLPQTTAPPPARDCSRRALPRSQLQRWGSRSNSEESSPEPSTSVIGKASCRLPTAVNKWNEPCGFTRDFCWREERRRNKQSNCQVRSEELRRHPVFRRRAPSSRVVVYPFMIVVLVSLFIFLGIQSKSLRPEQMSLEERQTTLTFG